MSSAGAGRDFAVRFTAPERAELAEEAANGDPLAPDEVAGRSLVSLVSVGTEISCYRGLIGTFPRGSGYATVFEVERVGEGVTDLARGDRVFCAGNHRLLQRRRREQVARVPDDLAPERAVFCRMAGITMSTLVTTTARPPDRVVVTGLGVVGLLGAQIFAKCGYEVTACDPVADRRALAESCGLGDVRERVPLEDERVCGQVSLVLECSGHEAAALDGCRVVAKRGEVVLVGVPWEKRADLPAFEVLAAVFRKYAVLRSGWEWEVPGGREDFRAGSLFDNYRAAMKWIAEGSLRVDGLAELRSPRECASAYRDLAAGECGRLSVIFDWRNT
ncbi:MAG: zinc-binding dehydrogenase [Planctomycetota bacterium]